MGKRKKPKFKIGDAVVVVIYGSVGEITEIKEFEQSYVYELDSNAEFYLESSLRLLSEENEAYHNVEQVNIDYKFSFGDVVELPNIGDDLYKVVGFRTEIWRYQDEAWEDIIYELARLYDGDWIECAEDEIELVQSQHKKLDWLEENDFLTNIKILNIVNKKEMFRDLFNGNKTTNVTKEEKINQLLDLYNDYKELKEQFGDEEFQRVLNIITTKLTTLVGTTK